MVLLTVLALISPCLLITVKIVVEPNDPVVWEKTDATSNPPTTYHVSNGQHGPG